MPKLTLRDVLRDARGHVHGSTPELGFEGVGTDTRALVPGSLFVALEGPRFDGHRFLAEAAAAGARAALVSRAGPPESAPLPQIRVADTLLALQELSAAHARRQSARRIAVTGSNGKTTTKELLRAGLSAGGNTLASPRSFNNHVGVPLTLLGIEEHTSFAVIELGTNCPGEIGSLAELAAPEVGLITNCCAAHLEKLGGLEGVIEEKGALLDHLPADGVAVLNADDDAFDTLRERARCKVVSFGVRRPADHRASDISVDLKRVQFQYRGVRVTLELGGCHNVYNALAALAVATELGLDVGEVVQRLRTAEGPPMRLQPFDRGPLQILDDTYNANPGSVEAAFRTLAAARDHRRTVVVLGTMKELGDQAEALHRTAGEGVGLLSDALLVAVGEFAECVREGALRKDFPEDCIVSFADTDAAVLGLPGLLRPGDRVLVKGSRAMAMERIVDALEISGAASAR